MDTMETAIAKLFKGVGHVRIDGSVPSSERAVRVRKFQTNAQVRVALLSMTAAGVGLTLTAASSVLFAELHWTPGVLAQAEDRCHRIGQQNAVNVMYCVCKDESLSVDMRLWAMLGRKVGTLGRVIDGCKVSILYIVVFVCLRASVLTTFLSRHLQTASMNASESSAMGTAQPKPGESVEDELTRFFAETSANDAKREAPAVPVKGSILSFFKPPAKKESPAAAAASKPSAAPKKHFTAPKPKEKSAPETSSMVLRVLYL
jgi:hypothetical protein